MSGVIAWSVSWLMRRWILQVVVSHSFKELSSSGCRDSSAPHWMLRIVVYSCQEPMSECDEESSVVGLLDNVLGWTVYSGNGLFSYFVLENYTGGF